MQRALRLARLHRRQQPIHQLLQQRAGEHTGRGSRRGWWRLLLALLAPVLLLGRRPARQPGCARLRHARPLVLRGAAAAAGGSELWRAVPGQPAGPPRLPLPQPRPCRSSRLARRQVTTSPCTHTSGCPRAPPIPPYTHTHGSAHAPGPAPGPAPAAPAGTQGPGSQGTHPAAGRRLRVCHAPHALNKQHSTCKCPGPAAPAMILQRSPRRRPRTSMPPNPLTHSQRLAH